MKKPLDGSRKIVVLAVLVLAGAAVFIGIFASLRGFVKVSDLKNFAEKRIGGILQANVSVNEVRVGFLDQISLRGLKIDQEVQDKLFYILDIKKVVFKYNIGRFWQRRFGNPNTVLLDSPEIVFRAAPLPLTFLDMNRFVQGGSLITDEIQFKEGRVGLSLPDFPVRMEIGSIQGHCKRVEGDIWRVSFEGKVKQLFEGVVLAEGMVNVATNETTMRLLFKNLQSTREDLPLKNINGTVSFDKESIRFESLTFEYSRIPVSVTGSLNNYETPDPFADLQVVLGTPEFGTRLKIEGALKDTQIQGDLEISRMKLPVSGKFQWESPVFRMKELVVAREYRGEAEFNYITGMYDLYLEKNHQRMRLALNLRHWDVDFKTQLDHLNFFNADLVTRARFRLTPDEELWKGGNWAFEGRLDTDYVILNQTPFDDFQGTFHLNASEVSGMHFTWGKSYTLEGGMVLKPPFPFGVKTRFERVDLEKMNSLFGQPLPEDFNGLCRGAVELTGEATTAEATGDITIADGTIGGFSYDQVTLRFRGMPPYLKLHDSRLKKGMRTLYLQGNINLSKTNVFEDIQATSSEKIVVWSGTELQTSKDQFLIRGLGQHVDISLTKGDTSEKGKKKEEEDSYVAVGPKIHF